MSTITDVAERAGVSITTVSHVINETRYVSDELTKRVYEAMRELNYRPNTLARSLRSGRTKTIGLVILDISLIGFDNIPISKSVYPDLTTIAQPIKEMADLVVDMLVNRITQKKNNRRINEEIGEYKRIVLETKLIERGTCRILD
jgi:LacI family transcriptional regulator